MLETSPQSNHATYYTGHFDGTPYLWANPYWITKQPIKHAGYMEI